MPTRDDARGGAARAWTGESALPVLRVAAWNDVFGQAGRDALAALLPEFLQTRRWFGAKARPIRTIHVTDTIPLVQAFSYLLMLYIDYEEGLPDRYVLPLILSDGDTLTSAAVVRVELPGGETRVLYESTADRSFGGELLNIISQERRSEASSGELIASHTSAFEPIRAGAHSLEPTPQKTEQSNSSIIYGDAFILKLFRRMEPGINPDLEIGRFLTEVAHFRHAPPVAGAIEYRDHRGEISTLAILQGFVRNEGDAWNYTLQQLRGYLERARGEDVSVPEASWIDRFDVDPPANARGLIGAYLDSAALLGRRTAEMHLALASATMDDFEPEPMTDGFRRALADRIETQAADSIRLLRTRLDSLPEDVRDEARTVLQLEPDILQRCRRLGDHPIRAVRIRHHGDYHLGQVLYTGNDFVIIDFEGEPARPLRERRMKRSPLRDVAGMLRSFDYASQMALIGRIPGVVRQEGESLGPAARFWTYWVSLAFVREYVRTAGGARFVPPDRGEWALLLFAYLLEKATYELAYELNNRPDWVNIPLCGILQLAGA